MVGVLTQQLKCHMRHTATLECQHPSHCRVLIQLPAKCIS